MKDTLLTSYTYHLPDELIAARPLSKRDDSRLLVYNQQANSINHKQFFDLCEVLPANSLLVLNESLVFPSRIFAKKISGGKAEFMILSLIPSSEGSYKVMIGCSRKKHIGDRFLLPNSVEAIITGINCDGTFFARFENLSMGLEEYLKEHGNIPIPTYIRDGVSDCSDKEQYQTVFAKNIGSVAAPTAGLHFTKELLDSLLKKNIDISYVTLHVGMGTFAPVKSENILDHKMHHEEFFIDSNNWKKILLAKQSGKKIFCVGTTALRTLESIWQNITIEKFEANKVYQTDIFLYPGKEILSIDGLITNFHLPKSTLLMLVSSIIGREKLLQIYEQAIKERYRFYSYGDAMLILRKCRSCL